MKQELHRDIGQKKKFSLDFGSMSMFFEVIATLNLDKGSMSGHASFIEILEDKLYCIIKITDGHTSLSRFVFGTYFIYQDIFLGGGWTIFPKNGCIDC